MATTRQGVPIASDHTSSAAVWRWGRCCVHHTLVSTICIALQLSGTGMREPLGPDQRGPSEHSD